MVTRIQKLKRIQEELAKLDAQYLLNYPKPIGRETYIKKRTALKKKFLSLK